MIGKGVVEVSHVKLMIDWIRFKGDHHFSWWMVGGCALDGCLIGKVRVCVVAVEAVDVMGVDGLQDLLELLWGVQMEESAWTEEVMHVLPWVFYALYSLLYREAHYHVRRDLEFYRFCILLFCYVRLGACIWNSLRRNALPLHILKVLEERVLQILSSRGLNKLFVLIKSSLDE